MGLNFAYIWVAGFWFCALLSSIIHGWPLHEIGICAFFAVATNVVGILGAVQTVKLSRETGVIA